MFPVDVPEPRDGFAILIQETLGFSCPPRTKSTMSWLIGSTCSNADTNTRRPWHWYTDVIWRPIRSIEAKHTQKPTMRRSSKYPQHDCHCFPEMACFPNFPSRWLQFFAKYQRFEATFHASTAPSFVPSFCVGAGSVLLTLLAKSGE